MREMWEIHEMQHMQISCHVVGSKRNRWRLVRRVNSRTDGARTYRHKLLQLSYKNAMMLSQLSRSAKRFVSCIIYVAMQKADGGRRLPVLVLHIHTCVRVVAWLREYSALTSLTARSYVGLVQSSHISSRWAAISIFAKHWLKNANKMNALRCEW